VPPRSCSSDRTKRYGRTIGLGMLSLLAFATPAGAATGGGGSGGGGATFVTKPKVAKVTCVRGCASRGRAQAGSTLRIAGSHLDGVRAVRFAGARGRADDAEAAVLPGASTARLQANVPAGAVTGPVVLLAGRSTPSAASRPVAILPPPPPDPNPVLSAVPGAPQLETGTSRTKAFVGARRAVTFSYRVNAGAAVPVRVELVNGRDGTVLKTWSPGAAQPGQVQSVSWDGRMPGGAAAPGRYSFRLIAETNGVVARSAQAPDLQRDAFDLFDHVFPIPAAHNYGGAGARFGSGRGGRSHQGHDVFAKCGAPLVAARGGKVQFTGYHRAAGNYLVIDGDGTDVDYAYMHLAQPTPFREGDRVYTGQRLGSVGDTGNAHGCHLHFEMWNAPGWYEGGRAMDPLPSLQAWDGWS
jgi:murein DD-endopeptidase MepM/ murein hydrolase activator NlpD